MLVLFTPRTRQTLHVTMTGLQGHAGQRQPRRVGLGEKDYLWLAVVEGVGIAKVVVDAAQVLRMSQLKFRRGSVW